MTADPAHFAQTYWDTAAETYVQDFTGTGIGGTRRQAVWRRLDKIFSPGQKLLELNCGTGEDALFLARNDISVTACDASEQMIQVARNRLRMESPDAAVTFRLLPTERIS